MNNIFSKLKDFVGLNEPVEYEYIEEEEPQGYQNIYQEPPAVVPQPPAPVVEEEPRPRRNIPRRTQGHELDMGGSPMNNVIGMPGATNGFSEVMVMEPRSFEEMPQAIQALRERKSVVLNLTMMDPDQAQRAVDFVAGGTYAIDGHQERIGESIFLFTPSCVQVSTQSGVSNEAPQSGPRFGRVPTPAWSEPAARMAQ